jgi:hypothetical protein
MHYYPLILRKNLFREDRFPVPVDAFREILLNAVMHNIAIILTILVMSQSLSLTTGSKFEATVISPLESLLNNCQGNTTQNRSTL